jgi:diketogulonate reductase-like aldo/keto reductase
MDSYPQISFGTYRLGKDTYQSLENAMMNGYRSIDTASLYQIEPVIGEYLGKNEINRSELWLTSKLNPKTYSKGKDDIISSIKKTLNDLNTSYLDLYLIHKPPADDQIIKCWSVLEEFHRQGIIRNIGVSNFDIHHMETIKNFSTIPIYTNQIELSPFLKRPNVTKYMKDNNIIISAHSSLAKGEKFNDDIISMISQKYSKSPAQVMLQWGIQHGFNVIPRSSKKNHIMEDISLDFEISSVDMNVLNNISIIHSTHPQYIIE